MASNNDERWYFTKDQLENSPSRRCGMDADKELSHRQQAANFIQDMGQRLQVTQLCINTAIVYMHRFYCFHSFTLFHRNAIASAALFLAAKVEEQPRKLEHIIKVAQMCLQKGPPPDRRNEVYLELAQELVINENILLMTLGFNVAIEHPHAFIVKFCHIANASKDLSQTSYFMASNSLHLTTMCLQYKPTVVACFCIHLSCQWSRWQIPKSKENLPWYKYIDQSVTEELLEQLTNEFLVIFDKCPSRLKKKIQNCQSGQNSMSGYIFDADRTDRKHNSNFSQHAQSSSSTSASSSSSSTKFTTSSAPSVVNGSKMHHQSTAVNNLHTSKPSNVSTESAHRKESAPPPPVLRTADPPPPVSSRTHFTPASDELISNVLKEVALANTSKTDKQRLSTTIKSEPLDLDVKPSIESSNNASSAKVSKNHSIFSPSPVGRDDNAKLSPFEDRMQSTTSVKVETLSPEAKRPRCRNISTSSGERELIPIVKKVDDRAGFEDIFKKNAISVSDFEGSPKQEPRDDRNVTNDVSHSHKKKKKHKEKDKKHDKEKHRHKDKKKHKEDKCKKDHKEKRPSKEHETVVAAENVQRIKITIPKERLMDIPAKPTDGPVKLKINLNHQVVTPAVSDTEENLKLKITKTKSRKRHRESDHEDSSKKFSCNGSDLHNGY